MEKKKITYSQFLKDLEEFKRKNEPVRNTSEGEVIDVKVSFKELFGYNFMFNKDGLIPNPKTVEIIPEQ